MTPKILLIEPDKTARAEITTLLAENYYEPISAENKKTALEMIQSEKPNLIIISQAPPQINASEIIENLKKQTANTIPIIILAGKSEDSQKNQLLLTGAHDFLSKPVNAKALITRIRKSLEVKNLHDELINRAQNSPDFSIEDPYFEEYERDEHKWLLVAKSEIDAQKWHEQIAPFSPENPDNIVLCWTEIDAEKHIKSQKFNAIIIAETLADQGIGMRLIANIRADWQNRNRAILFVAETNEETALKALDFGANDYLLAPLKPWELSTRLNTEIHKIWLEKNLYERFNKHIRLSVIDPLTELHNRRYLDEYLPRIIARAKRDQTQTALMVMDLDHFKSINDSYGHDFGDKVLVEFAKRMRDCLRAVDIIVRFGGEEFVIVTPYVAMEDAKIISERLRKIVSDKSFKTPAGREIVITTSVGVTMIKPDESDVSAIFKRADEALYEAKKAGRDQVNFAA